MEKKLRSLLLRILGTESYLSLVSDAYIRLTLAGRMKQKYAELFYLKQLIKPGFICVDIGANVGYYSVFLSRYAGHEGKVFSVEPVPMFTRVFQRNIGKFGLKNITLYPFALGSENRTVTLGTPLVDGVFRHGLTHVVEDSGEQNGLTYEAEMKIADELFASLNRIDFLKCDVEGYEIILFPQMIQTLKRTLPLIQLECSEPEKRKTMLEILTPLGYNAYGLFNESLRKLSAAEAVAYDSGDLYFSARPE